MSKSHSADADRLDANEVVVDYLAYQDQSPPRQVAANAPR